MCFYYLFILCYIELPLWQDLIYFEFWNFIYWCSELGVIVCLFHLLFFFYFKSRLWIFELSLEIGLVTKDFPYCQGLVFKILKWWWKASVFFREIFDVILDSFFVSVIFWFLLTITTVVFLDNTVMSQKLLIVGLLIVFKTRRQLLLACLRQHQKGLLLLLCWLHSLLYQKKIESSGNKCVSWKCFKFCLMANIFRKL